MWSPFCYNFLLLILKTLSTKIFLGFIGLLNVIHKQPLKTHFDQNLEEINSIISLGPSSFTLLLPPSALLHSSTVYTQEHFA